MKTLLLSLLCITPYAFSASEPNRLSACRDVLLSYSNKGSTVKDAKYALTVTSDALVHLASRTAATYMPPQIYTEVPIAGRPREKALCFLRQGIRQVQEALGSDAAHLAQTFLPCAERVIAEAFLPRPDFTKPESGAALRALQTYVARS